jgi:hypothetical protein
LNLYKGIHFRGAARSGAGRDKLGVTPMTESEWNTCTKPDEMLEFLESGGKSNERKLRLFTCACARRIWSLLTDERSRDSLRIAERFADGLATDEERATALMAADAAFASFVVPHDNQAPVDAGCRSALAAAYATEAASHAARMVADVTFSTKSVLKRLAEATAYNAFNPSDPHHRASDSAYEAERAAQVASLRDIFGHLPFRSVSLEGSCVTSDVLDSAKAIYQEQELPSGILNHAQFVILAGCLTNAGCNNEEILAHLHQRQAHHVRGCWVIDLLLSKE